MKRTGFGLILGAFIATLTFVAACGPPPPPGAVYVRVAPPPPLVEVVAVAPGPDFIWIRGYHRWDRAAYVWVPGGWERRPHARAVWVEGHWRHSRHGWYWVPGHWK